MPTAEEASVDLGEPRSRTEPLLEMVALRLSAGLAISLLLSYSIPPVGLLH